MNKQLPNLPGSDGEHVAQERFGTEKRALAFYNKQMLDYLNPAMCEFVQAQEMVFIATSDSKGHADSSVRFGPPGFVHVLDEKTILYPEYRGNGVMASVGNLIENPHIGLLFMDFLDRNVGLHVNGRAQIVEKEVLLERFLNADDQKPSEGTLFERLELNVDKLEVLIEATLTRGGRHPERWIAIEVEEAYIHCSKHIPRFKSLDKAIHWGTDDPQHKGGDAFGAKACPRPWVTPETQEDHQP